MKCRLCDRPTTPGTGKLCLDCTKALHRARASSPAVRKLSMSPPVQAEAMATDGSSVDPRPDVGPGTRLAAVQRLGGRRPRCDRNRLFHSVRSGSSARTRRGRRRSCAGVGGGTIPRSMPRRFRRLWKHLRRRRKRIGTEFPGATPAPQTKAELNVAKTSPSPAGARTPPRAGTRSTNANRDPSSSSAAHAFASDTATSKSNAPSQPETPQQLAHASVAPSASPPDGAQTFASAMEKCGKEAFLSSSSASRRCTCSTAKTSGTRIPAACGRQPSN